MAEDFGNLSDVSEPLRSNMAPLRTLVLNVAKSNPSIGPLEESLKWGEPSFTPMRKGVGSSVRIAPRKDGKMAMNFICHTGLIGRFRELYGQKLEFEGNRTIIIDSAKPFATEELRHCIGMALTYHLAK
jgi:hypothetical protein